MKLFLRKLTVLVVPLLLLLAAVLGMEIVRDWGFWTNVAEGALLGLTLSLLLPLSGASRQRDRFARLLWIPCAAMFLVIGYQYLASIGQSIPALKLLETHSGQTVFCESAFAVFMLVTGFKGRSE